MINPIPAKGHIPSLDRWRAIAILLVLGSHMTYAANFPPNSMGWVAYIFSGNLGVRIFFVLSGFLITLLLLRESDKNGRISLCNFYIRRVFRIFPVYFAYLAVLAVLTVAGLYYDSLSSWIGCLTFLRNIVGQGISATNHFWSLAVEEQFYIIWPFLFLCLSLWRRKRLFFLILLTAIIAAPIARLNCSPNPGGGFVNRILSEKSILLYIDSLAVGCVGAWFAWKIPNGKRWCRIEIIVLLSSLALIIGGRVFELSTFSEHHQLYNALIPSIQAWAILTCLWMTASERSPVYRFLNSWPVTTLGILSYSIYVWHFLFLSHFMGSHFSNIMIYNWKYWLFPALAVSALSYYFLEKPMIKFGQRFRS